MRTMDADEREVCNFLKAYAGQYVSAREINRRAGGKWRFKTKHIDVRLVGNVSQHLNIDLGR